MVTDTISKEKQVVVQHSQQSMSQRKPFLEVIREWTPNIKLDENKTSRGPSVYQARDETTTSLDNLREEMSHLKNAQEKFIFACRNGDDTSSCELLLQLLADYPTVNLSKIIDRKQSNASMLHLLAQRNKLKCLELLTSSDKLIANLDVQDSMQSTPLLYAVAHNCEETTAYLLSRRVNVNAKDIYNKFPMMMALRNKNYRIADMLASSLHLDIHLKGTKALTVLHLMAEEGDLESVQFLVERCNASPYRRDNNEENVLYKAITHTHIVTYLTKQFQNRGLGKLIVNVNALGMNLLHRAIECNCFDSFIYILKAINSTELSEHQISSFLNTPDKTGNTPLISAIKDSKKEFARFLCDCREVKINEGDRLGRTALHYAAQNNNADIINCLTKCGASFKAVDQQESEPKKVIRCSCCRSLSTILTEMLATVTVLCIVFVLSVCIGFFVSNISEQALNFRQKSFSEVMDYLSYSIDQHATIARNTFAQIEDTAMMRDEKSAFRISYSAFMANFRKSVYMTASYMMLKDVRTIGISSVKFAENIYGGSMYSNYNNSAILYYKPIFDLDNSTWRDIYNRPYEGGFPFFNPAELQWIAMSEKANKSFWTPAYAKTPLPDLYFGFLTPFRDPITNEYIGHYGLDGVLDAVSTYVQQKAKEIDSTIVVIEKSTGFLVGSSDRTVPLYTLIDGVNVARADGTNTTNPDIGAMIRFARSKYGGVHLSKVQEKQRIFDEFMMDNKMHVINIGSVWDEFGIDWIVLQTLPKRYFYKSFYNSLIVIAVVSVVIILSCIVLSIIGARLFMRPIENLIQQANEIKMLQLDKVEKSLEQFTPFSEIEKLQDSFRSMTSRLKQFKQFIPNHILAVIEAEISSGLTTGSTFAQVSTKEKRPSLSLSASTALMGNKGMVTRALNSKLSSGPVTVLTVSIPDLVEVLETYSAEEISEATKDIFNALTRAGKETECQLVSMNSKNIVAVWNSFIPQADHIIRACNTAGIYLATIAMMEKQWTEKGLPNLRASIGITSGIAYFGNIGGDVGKFFTVIGAPQKLSMQLCNRNEKHGTQVMVSEEVYEEVKHDYHMRCLGRTDETVMYELGDQKKQDEWVNEMNSSSTNSLEPQHKWKTYNEAYTLYNNGHFSEALDKFNSYLQQDPTDVQCRIMLDLCDENMTICSTDSNN
jgi:ankyrin repeat protein/class 3 adenylate cyclase